LFLRLRKSHERVRDSTEEYDVDWAAT
jgi:hypothetical protein